MDILATLGTQFSLAKFISRVSSILTTLASGGMKKAMPLSKVVLPLPVPPVIKILHLYCTRSQKYASISGDNVFNASNWTGVKGIFVNFLIVKVGPRLVTSVVYVALTREPSGRLPSSKG